MHSRIYVAWRAKTKTMDRLKLSNRNSSPRQLLDWCQSYTTNHCWADMQRTWQPHRWSQASSSALWYRNRECHKWGAWLKKLNGTRSSTRGYGTCIFGPLTLRSCPSQLVLDPTRSTASRSRRAVRSVSSTGRPGLLMPARRHSPLSHAVPSPKRRIKRWWHIGI